MKLWAGLKRTSGANVSKMAELQLMIVRSKTAEIVAEVWEVIHSNRRSSVREVAEEGSISRTICHEILMKNLGISCTAVKFVPRLLRNEQKQIRVHVGEELSNQANEEENFSKNIITGDETLVYGYDVDTKAQSSQWVST
jgi:hypothetical protein